MSALSLFLRILFANLSQQYPFEFAVLMEQEYRATLMRLN